MSEETQSCLLAPLNCITANVSDICSLMSSNNTQIDTLVDKNTKIPLKLIKKTEISHDTRIFRFVLPSPKHVLGLPTGNHVSLSCRINGKLTIRSYTPITSDESDYGYVDLIVKVYKPNVHPKFPEGGKMTMFLENLNLGDSINFSGPVGKIEYLTKGQFIIKKKGNEVEERFVTSIGMIAGGSGITPMLQIIRKILKFQNDKTKVNLLYANQTEEDILCKTELEQAVEKSKGRLNVFYTLDRPPVNWTGFTGFINQEMLAKSMPEVCIISPGFESLILICGPPPMVKFACLPNLAKLAVQENDIFVY